LCGKLSGRYVLILAVLVDVVIEVPLIDIGNSKSLPRVCFIPPGAANDVLAPISVHTTGDHIGAGVRLVAIQETMPKFRPGRLRRPFLPYLHLGNLVELPPFFADNFVLAVTIDVILDGLMSACALVQQLLSPGLAAIGVGEF